MRRTLIAVPILAFAIALSLGVILFVHNRLDTVSLVLHVALLSIPFAFIARSAKYLCRAMPLGKRALLHIALVQLSAALVVGAIWVPIAALAGWMISSLSNGELIGVDNFEDLGVFFLTGFIAYTFCAFVTYLLIALEEVARAEKQVVESKCLALDAELKALRAKLHPHFLFNSLNSIAALTSIDSSRARDMCIHLSDFLRHSLTLSSRQHIKLSEELALIRAYLNVEKIRFSDRMSVTEEIENDVDDILIPPLLLQPLVENAVKHGVSGLEEGGEIRIAVSIKENILQVRIENPVDEEVPELKGTGQGLFIVKERLRNMFGDRASLSAKILNQEKRLFVAELLLPAKKE